MERENYIIAKILSGTATEEEKLEYYSALQESKDKEKLHYEMKNLWARTSKLNYDIDLKKERALFWQSIDRKARKSIFYRIFRYAAIIVFAVGVGILGTLYLNRDAPGTITQTYRAEKGSVAKIEVDEGTTIWLNSATEVRYIKDLATGKRKVFLSGEALFDVKFVQESPFVVYAGDIAIYDFGTTFNVKAYRDDKEIETTLIEGKVELRSNEGEPLLSLEPGQIAIYEQSSAKLSLEEADVLSIAAWREGKFIFHNKRLEAICKELEKWYDVKFIFNNESMKREVYTGRIKRSTTVSYVLEMLKLSTKLNFEIEEKTGSPDVVTFY